ncbi:MAG: hypothetical protein GX963_05195 [Bacteroidales bacterium]|nr:hypothetical protein [Bacteroidales bacterium]
MKTNKWILLIITFIGLAFIACSDDDDGTVSDDILGEWTLKSVDIGVLEASDIDIKEAAEEVYEEIFGDVYSGEIVEFNENGKCIFGGDQMRFSTKGSTIIIKDEEGLEMNLSYTIRGEQLTLTLDMKKMIIDTMSGELSKEELNYLKQTLKKFTINFTCIR